MTAIELKLESGQIQRGTELGDMEFLSEEG